MNDKLNTKTQSNHLTNTTNVTSERDFSLLEAEFTALKDEILERSRFQHQLVSLNLIATGTFLGVGLRPGVPASILLVWPFLTMFIAVAWEFNDFHIGRIGLYIKTDLEEKTALGWEHFIDSLPETWRLPFWSSIFFHARGLFLGTQILMVVLASLGTDFKKIDVILYCLDLAAIVATFLLLRPSKTWSKGSAKANS